jgi:hypothetical protein
MQSELSCNNSIKQSRKELEHYKKSLNAMTNTNEVHKLSLLEKLYVYQLLD